MTDLLPVKPTITFSDFNKIDVRVGRIIRVEAVETSDKLARLTVSFGSFERKILAGIRKERSDIQEIAGKQALFVVNLESKKMAGELSEGMLFDIGYQNNITPVLAVPEKEIPDGVSVG